MFVAEKLRKSSMAGYLLYLWQVEDLMRAFQCDFDKLRDGYLVTFKDLSPSQRADLEEWYRNLASMMHREGVVNRGHLQISRNVVLNLEEMHARLMGSANFPYYHSAYQSALPIIVELRSKSGDAAAGEIETCFNLMYGVMLLRMQKKPVSEATQRALTTVTTFIEMLSDYYMKDKEEPLDL